MKKIILAVLLLPAGSAWSAETAQFLKIGVGARELGQGNVGTALADDTDALYWNAAGLSRMEKREVMASHSELTQDARLDNLAFAHPTSRGVFAAGLTYLSQSALEGRDALGHPTGNLNASDAAGVVSFARKGDLADAGVNLKLIQSHIGSAQASGAAVDLGLKRAFGALTLGAAMRNLGPGLRFQDQRNDLPLQLAFGVAWRFQGGHSVVAEVLNGPRGDGTDVGFGGEYQAMKAIFLRAGYTTQSAVTGGSSFDVARGLTLGLGWRNGRYRFDYAALPTGELGTSHRFTLGMRWQ